MTLAEVLSRRRALGRRGFVPFIAAGDPSLGATADFLKVLARAGADLIELGIPFSDPVADGPVIQAAAQRALKAGTTLAKVLRMLKGLRRKGFSTPVVIFAYLNPVLRLGFKRFARLCADSRANGVLVVDLPAEESGPLAKALAREGVELVLLASPTTSDQRLRLIGRFSGSIVYYVSWEGVTGVRRGLAPHIWARLRKARALLGKPVIVGFGVSTRAQARAMAPVADGVVVGSALVRAAAEAPSRREALRRLSLCARRIVSGLKIGSWHGSAQTERNAARRCASGLKID